MFCKKIDFKVFLINFQKVINLRGTIVVMISSYSFGIDQLVKNKKI